MAGCTSPSQVPPFFDAIDRIPIKTVRVQGHQIAYLDQGTGPPVILIHGFGGSMWQWEHQQQALTQQFRLITLDLLGSGLSEKPEIEYLPDQMLDFLVGFMDALQIPNATLIGNSMGAGLALGMALKHPTRVEKLVLIDGLPPQIMKQLTSPTLRGAIETRMPVWLISLGNWLFNGIGTESFLKEMVHDHRLLTSAVIERSNRNRRRPGIIHPIMAVRNALPVWERDYAPHLTTITHPTLLIWGEQDQIFPLPVGKELHRLIPHSQFVGIPDAGHLPQWERPDLVNRLLIEYIH